MMKTLSQLLLVLMLALLPAIYCRADQDYRAALSGKNEVPQVKTPATGDFRLTVSDNGLTFELDVDDITSPVAANIHRGRTGEKGPPVAGIFGGPTKLGHFSGILSTGTITGASLIGELQGKSVSDLLDLIKSGNAYVNILTDTYPSGEIRGQIRAE